MGNPVHSRPGSIASPAIACLTAPTAPDPSTRLLNRPTESHRPGPRLSSPACCPADPAPAPLPRTAIGAPNDNQRPPPAPFIGIERGPSRPTALTPCSNPKAAPHRWIRAKSHPKTQGNGVGGLRTQSVECWVGTSTWGWGAPRNVDHVGGITSNLQGRPRKGPLADRTAGTRRFPGSPRRYSPPRRELSCPVWWSPSAALPGMAEGWLPDGAGLGP